MRSTECPSRTGKPLVGSRHHVLTLITSFIFLATLFVATEGWATEKPCTDLLAFKFSKTKQFLKLSSREIQDQMIVYRPYLIGAPSTRSAESVVDLLTAQLADLKIPYVRLQATPSTNIAHLEFESSLIDNLETLNAHLRRLAFVEYRYTLIIDVSGYGSSILTDTYETRKFWRRIRAARTSSHPIRPAALILVTTSAVLEKFVPTRDPDMDYRLLEDLKFRPVRIF